MPFIGVIIINLEAFMGRIDPKNMNNDELAALCAQIRAFLVDSVSHTGGHLASNLGIVELTVAIHRVFDTRHDRLVFDVGHQCYVHKILTGRAGRFDTLRQFGGISGFPKPSESEEDAFIAGHASNAVSVATGMARARTLLGDDYNVIALVGDGALTGGLCYEGLNDAGESGEKIIVILNDNGMSIDENVGGMSKYLAKQRLKPGYFRFKKGYRRLMAKIPGGKHIYNFTHRIKKGLKNAILQCSMFEDMGFTYLGPVDGHDIDKLTYILKYASEQDGPVLVHVCTVKGKGYQFSEFAPDFFHGIGAFEPLTGELNEENQNNFSNAFGDELLNLAKTDNRICAITAAMKSSTGLDKFFECFPTRSFDVGIAEQHAVAMAAGMAAKGLIPVCAIYSTFLQRSYDMLIHDVSLSNLHVVFGVDRAGITGGDGETHQGIFDVGFLCQIPHIKVLCPSNYCELREMLRHAIFDIDGPVAVRYPRGEEGKFKDCLPYNVASVVKQGTDITLVTYGILVNTALSAAELMAKEGISCEVIKLGSISPIDFSPIMTSVVKTRNLMVLEDCVAEGCVGQRLACELAQNGVQVNSIQLKNCGDGFVTHGSVEKLMESLGLDPVSLKDSALTILGKATAV